MRPEMWQTVRRLLLLCYLQSDRDLLALNPSIQRLFHCLANTDIQLFILRATDYIILSPDSQIEQSITNAKSVSYHDHLQLINGIKTIAADAAIIFTEPTQSPFALAYFCYLAGISIRLGQSQEFGGGVLSHCIKPSLDNLGLVEHYLHLLQMAGFSAPEQTTATITRS